MRKPEIRWMSNPGQSPTWNLKHTRPATASNHPWTYIECKGTKGHPATYLLSLCSPLTILISFRLWNYTQPMEATAYKAMELSAITTSPSHPPPLGLVDAHSTFLPHIRYHLFRNNLPHCMLPACTSSKLSRSL